MSKLTLDMNTFKALASDTRLDILRCLDGKNMSLNDICKATNLNKATLHEHLVKLNEAGLIKKNEREGHKWVYYRLTWKGEGLLHPENTKIVVMFSITFISLLIAVMLIVNFLQPITIGIAETRGDTTYLWEVEDKGIPFVQRSYSYNYLGNINAQEKTVGNITTELQQMASPRNSIGANYADEDIVWYKAEDSNLILEDTVSFSLYKHGYIENTSSVDPENISIDPSCCKIMVQNSQAIVEGRFLNLKLSNNYTNNTDNTTEWLNDIYDNETKDYPTESELNSNDTNESNYSVGAYYDEYVDYSPLVPKMIATVHDSSLLYLAVICVIFFGTLFTFSTWRLWVNKKPKL